MKKLSNQLVQLTLTGTALAIAITGCTKKSDEQAGTDTQKTTTTTTTTETKSSSGVTEMKTEDIKTGTGTAAEPGKTVSVHYTGWLTDGKEFDSSKKRGQPFKFQLGAGQVIKGWDQGVAGMKVGGVRKLTIPPQMAYGDRDVGGGLIPANSTLVFEVELLDVS